MHKVAPAVVFLVLALNLDAGPWIQTGQNAESPKALAEAFFAAHTRGDVAAIEAMYAPGATVSSLSAAQGGTAQVLAVKQYLGWFQSQFAARSGMKFMVGPEVLNAEGNFAVIWIPIDVHETMKDGSQTIVRVVASLHMFRGGSGWKISAHAWNPRR